MYNLLYNKPQKLMLLAGCSTVCTTVAEAAKMWNLVVLCYGASSPALSDRNRFPTLFRTHPSATVHNPTRIKLMEKFGWSRVAILQQAEEVFISTVEDLEARCKDSGIEIVTRQSFLSDPTDAVRNLRRQDARIIVGLFYVVAARRVLCEMYKQNIYGKSYVWFFIGWYEDNWFEVNLEKEEIECTREQMRMAAEGHLTTEALMWNQNNQTTISGKTSEDFRLRLNEVLRQAGYDIDNMRYPEGYQEAPLAYDAVWAVALAFNKTMELLNKHGKSLKNFTYTNKEIADDIYSAINSTHFLGVSLGFYDTQNDNLTWLNRERWSGGKVPQDRTIVRIVLRTVSLPLFICMWTISVIQSSHPVCNTIMLTGICICLCSVFLLGLDGQFVSPHMYPVVCQARAWLLCIGFTLAYGAMFSKVWRVHRLTTKAKSEVKTFLHAKSVLKKEKKAKEFGKKDPVSTEDDIKIRPELEHCESQNNNVWLGVMYGYKGLVLVFGLFLAYETRSIKVKQINDSRYVGMSIYNVVVLCLITAPVTMVIASQQDASFAFVALAVIEVIHHPRDKAESKYNPDVGLTKEDEERYQKLVAENEELQKLISAKEEKIRLIKMRLQERDALRGGVTDGRLPPSSTPHQDSTATTGLTTNKDTLIVADFITGEGTSDSAFGGGVSVYTRSSRASQSDFEFSESYL
ncbi:Gamma-aminobutyric acid type B receptor subunit 1 [Blattella germanica]|nr:Gamma-aminobutyric acid type B receptor subunit 1 [Blattella germanica]